MGAGVLSSIPPHFLFYILSELMPKLLEETDVTIEMRDLARRSPITQTTTKGHIHLPSRSSGKHVSAVLRYCAIAAKILKPGEPLEEDLPLWLALGFAWEEFAASLYPEICWQPGEMERDGVYGTPDGLSTLTNLGYGVIDYAHRKPTIASRVARKLANLPDLLCAEEFKFTRKKTKRGDDILKEWLWIQQMSAYCGFYQDQARYSRLHVAYINGDYKPLEPKYMRYVFLYSDADVESTWRMINKNKDRAGVANE